MKFVILAREETMDDFWPLGISCHDKKEIWFMEMSANGHSILEQLGYKPRTSYIRGRKNELVSQRPNIFSIMPIMHSSILKSMVELRSKSMLMCSSPVEFLCSQFAYALTTNCWKSFPP